MEGSIGEEIYSDVMKMPKTESDPQSISKDETRNPRDIDGDDLWDDDGGDDMERQWQRRQQEFHRLGYREGLMAGKEAAAQEGFNLGFKESVFAGQSWGLVRGVTSALARLPDDLKQKLVETEEKRRRFQSLHESVRSVSTKDALKLFYDGLNDGGQTRDGVLLKDYSEECKMLVRECSALSLNGEATQTGSGTGGDSHSQIPDGVVLKE
ncbi:OLC1v1009672C1 [Oldenlandia corymbosa var. corymbosa]|uniref:OLC1v1009672C1 n=1 Tax=Oldenlandia corymbosa var. corymbosa TaxID=529605 RepID=A0AAV1DPJ5_OLDCO|nr:OLC1v1009672C1 [Oldenlandia corymbosa var. corymbosa]